MSSRALQQLVNAQVEINRAVFEANQAKPDDAYIAICIAEAHQDLGEASRMLLGVRSRGARRHHALRMEQAVARQKAANA